MINLKCTFAVTAGLCSFLAYAQKQPHIILIMTDQQRGDAMGNKDCHSFQHYTP